MTGEAAHGAPQDTRARFDEWVAKARRTIGGFSVRTKILGIVLALTTVLGLVVTWQVRTVLTGVLMNELDSALVSRATRAPVLWGSPTAPPPRKERRPCSPAPSS